MMDFHTRHKLLLLAHSPEHYRQMGRVVAGGKGRPIAEIMPGTRICCCRVYA